MGFSGAKKGREEGILPPKWPEDIVGGAERFGDDCPQRGGGKT